MAPQSRIESLLERYGASVRLAKTAAAAIEDRRIAGVLKVLKDM